MNEMTLNLNGKLINATQCTNKYQSIPGAVRGTGNAYQTDGSKRIVVKPLPEGLEAFGPTYLGVKVQNNEYETMHENDWYLVRHGQNHGIIIDDETFKYIFKDELGI